MIIYSYATRNNIGTLHFIWRVPGDASEEELSAGNLSAMHKIGPSLPVYHTRAMRKQFFEEMKPFNAAKPAVLREMYRRLTGENWNMFLM